MYREFDLLEAEEILKSDSIFSEDMGLDQKLDIEYIENRASVVKTMCSSQVSLLSKFRAFYSNHGGVGGLLYNKGEQRKLTKFLYSINKIASKLALFFDGKTTIAGGYDSKSGLNLSSFTMMLIHIIVIPAAFVKRFANGLISYMLTKWLFMKPTLYSNLKEINYYIADFEKALSSKELEPKDKDRIRASIERLKNARTTIEEAIEKMENKEK